MSDLEKQIEQVVFAISSPYGEGAIYSGVAGDGEYERLGCHLGDEDIELMQQDIKVLCKAYAASQVREVLEEVKNKVPLGWFPIDPKTGKNEFYSEDFQKGFNDCREAISLGIDEIGKKWEV